MRIEFVQSECEISRDEMYIRAEYISLLDSTFGYFDHHFLSKSEFLVQKKDTEIFTPEKKICIETNISKFACLPFSFILSLFVLFL